MKEATRMEKRANELDLSLFNISDELKYFVTEFKSKLTVAARDRLTSAAYDIDAMRGHVRIYMNAVDREKTS